MTFKELPPEQRNHVNGVISNFINTFIRTNRVWTAEQAYEELQKKIYEGRKIGKYSDEKMGDPWLTSEEARAYILPFYEEQRRKNLSLAKRPSPVEERLRFGRDWEGSYDINWGLKNGSDYEKAEVVENMTLTPWSITHVENELQKKYGKDIPRVLKDLSRSPIERKFYRRWIALYYSDKENPALIPEVSGNRKKFDCYEDTESGEYFFENDGTRRKTNVRFDFAIINYQKQKKVLIELDGQNFHKTEIQRRQDAVKRNIVENLGWHMMVFTGAQVTNELDVVFQSLDDFWRNH